MVTEQKRAWLVIGVCALALVGLLVAIPLTGGIRAVAIVFAVCAFCWLLGQLLFHKKWRRDKEKSTPLAKSIVWKSRFLSQPPSCVASTFP